MSGVVDSNFDTVFTRHLLAFCRRLRSVGLWIFYCLPSQSDFS